MASLSFGPHIDLLIWVLTIATFSILGARFGARTSYTLLCLTIVGLWVFSAVAFWIWPVFGYREVGMLTTSVVFIFTLVIALLGGGGLLLGLVARAIWFAALKKRRT